MTGSLARDQIAARPAYRRIRQRADAHQHLPRAVPDALCVHLLTDESARGISVHLSIPSIYDFEFNT